MKDLLALVTILLFLFSQESEFYHPELKWKKFQSKHFDILFHDGTENSALLLATIADSAFPILCNLYQFTPQKRITWIVKDFDDYSNGGAFFLDNKVEIFTEHLNFDLRGTHAWLHDVVTHELTHMIHIQKAFSAPMNVPLIVLQAILYETERRKDVVRGFPNQILNLPIPLFNIPPWIAEGLAQYQSNEFRYDYRDSQREMILMDRIKYDRLLTIDEMSAFRNTSVHNESVYNQGFSFIKYLAEFYGDSVIEKIALENKSLSTLYDFSSIFQKVFQKNLDSLYHEWKTYIKQKYPIEDSPKFNTQIISNDGEANLYPQVSPNQKFLAYLSSKNENSMSKTALYLFDLTTNKERKLLPGVNSPPQWFSDSKRILYSRSNSENKHGSRFNELYVYNIETGKEEQITINARARNPKLHADSVIVYTSSYDGTSQLLLLTLKDIFKDFIIDYSTFYIKAKTDVSSSKYNQREARVKGHLRFLTHSSHFRQYYHGTFLSADSFLVDYSDDYLNKLAILNIQSGEMSDLKNDSFDFRLPFTDGQDIYYATDMDGRYSIQRLSDHASLSHPYSALLSATFVGKDIIASVFDSLSFKLIRFNTDSLWKKSDNKMNRISAISSKRFSADTVNPQINTYKGLHFNSYYLVPRLFLDGERIKLGSIFFVNEILNKAQVYLAFSFNDMGERDIYAGMEFRNFYWQGIDPIFGVDIYHQHVKINDQLHIQYDENPQVLYLNRKAGFNLWQFELSIKSRLFNSGLHKFSYINSRYQAELEPTISNRYYDNGVYKSLELPFLRYDYHLGSAYEWRYLGGSNRYPEKQMIYHNGWRFYSRLSFNNYRFLDDFEFSAIGINEIYNRFRFYTAFFDLKFFQSISPYWKDAFLLSLNYEGNSEFTDSFYEIAGGSMIGMKAYPLYALQGRQKSIATIAYQFSPFKQINLSFGPIHLNQISFQFSHQFADAWTFNKLQIKQGSGMGFRTQIAGLNFSFEAHFPWQRIYQGQKNSTRTLVYPKEWRYYLMLSFDYELLETI